MSRTRLLGSTGGMESGKGSPEEADGGEDSKNAEVFEAAIQLGADSEPNEETIAGEKLLEEEAQKALACPCVADLRNGKCGEEFSTAFVCYIKSRTPEKGSDCVPSFKSMQQCMRANEEAFLKGTDLMSGKQSDHISNIVKEKQGPLEEVHPPRVDGRCIRFPPWYTHPDPKNKDALEKSP